ncbi:MAG TPA: glycosyltransferase family 39 protein [Verrucomicrobiae bacterium]|nr:glycosyltransferase family 39 protein [Verrucomicrobiae bacterium]
MDSSRTRLLAALAFLLAGALIFARLGQLPLTQPDEGRNAEVAREMKDSGSWLVPTYNGLPYLDKPAFYFKTVALSFALFGDTETAARLSSALSGFLLLVLTFAFVRREYGPPTGALAAIVVATSPLFLAFSRLVIFDMMLTLFACGAIFAGYVAEQKRGRARAGWYLLGAASSALATLVKGPVGFILPALVLGAFHVLDRRWDALRRFFAPANLLVFFGLTLPWFLGVNHQYRDFAYYGLVEESLHRYTTTEFRRVGPFYYYVPWIVIGLFTWSVLLPESIVAAWRARRRWTSADRLLIVWTIVVIVFFSLSKSKRPDYILSVIVVLGALTARVLALALETRDGPAARLLRRDTAVLAFVCLAGTGCLVALLAHPSRLEAAIEMPNGSAMRLGAVLTRLAIVLLLGAAAAAATWWRRSAAASLAVFVGVPLAVLTMGFDGVRLYANDRSARALADQIPPLPAHTELACLECFPNGLPFYRRQLLTVFTDAGREFTSNYIVFMLKKTNPWPPGVVPLDQRDQWLASRTQPVLLLARLNTRKKLDAIAAARGATVTNLFGGWSAALLPAPKAP